VRSHLACVFSHTANLRACVNDILYWGGWIADETLVAGKRPRALGRSQYSLPRDSSTSTMKYELVISIEILKYQNRTARRRHRQRKLFGKMAKGWEGVALCQKPLGARSCRIRRLLANDADWTAPVFRGFLHKACRPWLSNCTRMQTTKELDCAAVFV
jgi:hypothetical protein